MASGAENADVTAVRVGRAEPADNEGDLGGFADGVFLADEDIERLAWSGFAEPWLEIVEELGDTTHAFDVEEFGLSEETRDAGNVELVADGGETEVASEVNERIDGATDGVIGAGLGVDA